MANLILDSIIEQAKKRNAQILQQNQARWAPKPVAPAPAADGGSSSGDGGETSGSFFSELSPTNTPLTNQQQYDAAAKFLSLPLAARVAMPFGGVQTLGAQYQLNEAAQNPYVATDLRVGDPFAPESALKWAEAQPQLAQKEINPAWNEMRSRVVLGSRRDADAEAGIASMGGFGDQQMGMSLGNFGETPADPSAEAASSGGNEASTRIYDPDAGGWTTLGGIGGADVRMGGGGFGDDSWGGAGMGAIGGGWGDAGYSGEDFGGYA